MVRDEMRVENVRVVLRVLTYAHALAILQVSSETSSTKGTSNEAPLEVPSTETRRASRSLSSRETRSLSLEFLFLAKGASRREASRFSQREDLRRRLLVSRKEKKNRDEDASTLPDLVGLLYLDA